MVRPVDVLGYWFGDANACRRSFGAWCDPDPRTEAEVRERFAGVVAAAQAGRLRTWAWSLHGSLALVLVLSVFTRHLERGRPQRLVGDRRAQAVALRVLASRGLTRLGPRRRALLYLPLSHAEDTDLQARAVDGYRRLVAGEGDAYRPFLERALERQEMVERFGRFPHRNRSLGRSTTPQEAAWLRTDAPAWVVARLPAKAKTP